jgi:hypothetical protein
MSARCATAWAALVGSGVNAALLVILGILVLACAIGVLEFRRPPRGVIGGAFALR